MKPTRLFRSIVVFGTSLGAGATLAATTLSGCELYLGSDPRGGGGPKGSGWSGIDAGFPIDSHHDGFCDGECVDAQWGIIDAPMIHDAWGTIADAPNNAEHK